MPNLGYLGLYENNLTSIDFLLDLQGLAEVDVRVNQNLITNDAHYYDGVYYPRSQAREVIETLKDRGVIILFAVVYPY